MLFTAAHSVKAQQYNFHHYNVENGFPQANADEIIQDHLGYIWVTTQVGAVRFDGTDYFILNKSKGLINNLTTTLYQDKEFNLWIGTRSGLALYNYDSIVNFSQEDGLPGKEIRHIWEDLDGKLWIMTYDGLCYKSGDQFIPVELPLDNQIISSHVEKNGNLLFGTTKGLLKQTGSTSYTVIYPDLQKYKVTDIEFHQNKDLWLATDKSGLIRVGDNGQKIYDQKTLRTNAIREVLSDSRGELWVGTEGNGMFRYDGASFHHYSTQNGMYNTSVLELMEDIEGNIWIGGRNGIVVYDPTNPFTHYPQANKGNKESIFGMLIDSRNNYWFASFGGGLAKFDGQNWSYFTRDDGLPDNRLFSVIEDHKANLWIATAGHGIVKFNRENFTVYDADNGFLNARVFKIFWDYEDNIWCCTQFEGIARYNGKDFEQFTKEDGLPGSSVMSGELDTVGDIWFGTIGNGIFKYEQGQFIIPEIEHENTPTYIRSIVRDSLGNMWFGSASKGVCRLIKKADNTYSCYSITTEEGLNSNNIYFLLCDDQNQLWAGTEKGINRIVLNNKQEAEKIYTYGKADGFIGVETSINGAMIDRDGSLWFASIIGATRYQPGIEQQNTVEPKTHITGLKLFYEETDWSKYADSIDIHQLPVNLALSYNQSHLTFNFDALSFTNPQQVFYQYKLEGLEKNWSPQTRKKEAVYANVPPGEYTFKVKACNNDGLWNKKPVTFSFIIKPPFWQKTWFYIVVTMMLISIVAAIIRIRIYQYKKAKRILEKTVTERTREIAQQKNEIQEKNEELNQRNEEIAAQRDEIEEQKDRIEDLFREQTNSIKYARHIQKAILPNATLLKEHLNDFFIFFKPQSIVSGDFYYTTYHRNWLIIAAVDSTGHGVPGGFMSMLGISFLNEIVYALEEIHVDQILNKLRTNIIYSLKQKGKPGEHKEGMEMSMIAIHKQTGMCQYAGASSPMLLARAANQEAPDTTHIAGLKETVLYRFEPDKMPISIYPKMDDFVKQEFKVFPGDKLYLYSDGFMDQYGGPDIKKISSQQFQELIIKTATLPMDNQRKELETFYHKWKKNELQIDDILVMGIEI